MNLDVDVLVTGGERKTKCLVCTLNNLLYKCWSSDSTLAFFFFLWCPLYPCKNTIFNVNMQLMLKVLNGKHMHTDTPDWTRMKAIKFRIVVTPYVRTSSTSTTTKMQQGHMMVFLIDAMHINCTEIHFDCNICAGDDHSKFGEGETENGKSSRSICGRWQLKLTKMS